MDTTNTFINLCCDAKGGIVNLTTSSYRNSSLELKGLFVSNSEQKKAV